MKPGALLLAFAGALSATSVHATSIAGMSPGIPLKLERARVQAHGDTLFIGRESGPHLEVSPWPGFLPRRFPESRVIAERGLDPGGPVDSISLACGNGSRPFARIASGARSGSDIVQTWELALTPETGWSARERATGASQPLQAESMLKAGGWTLHILEIPARKTGAAAREAIPSLSWVAIDAAAEKRCASRRNVRRSLKP